MKIFFKGSRDSYEKFKETLNLSFSDERTADVCIYEISSPKDAENLTPPKDKPYFLFVSVKDRLLLEKAQELKPSGLFFPPLNKDIVSDKIQNALKAVSEEYNVDIKEREALKAKIIAKAENIPPLPTVARELIMLTSNDKTKSKLIIEKIKEDQGLSSKVLKLVNSPFYGVRQEIASIDRAALLLGLSTIKNLALALTTRAFFSKNFSVYETTGNQLWMHSFQTARICESIASLMPNADVEAAYLSGLMHDIGKTILVDFLKYKASSPDLEIKQLGIDHQEAAEIILSGWGIADYIIKSIANHHEMSPDSFSKTLYYANQIENYPQDLNNICDTASEFIGIRYHDLQPKINALMKDDKDIELP